MVNNTPEATIQSAASIWLLGCPFCGEVLVSMNEFSSPEIEQIDALWRLCPSDHVWTGWARPGGRTDEIWIFRQRANWRRFTLVKRRALYFIYDEKRRIVAKASSLERLLARVDAIPGLNDALPIDPED